MFITDHLLKLKLLVSSLALLIILASPQGRILAQEPWPPFWFDLIPEYAAGKMTYEVNLYSRVEWPLANLTIRIPLPVGTRFLEGNAPAGINVSSDGQSVTFSTAVYGRYIENAFFTVQVTDPALTVFTTQAQVTWQGDHPGGHLTEAVSYDITRPVLDWKPIPDSRLELGMKATLADGMITYALYPRAVGRPRMWDLKITVPLPAGTAFVSAEAAPPFTANFDGQEASFFILELARQAEVQPLLFKVSITDPTRPAVATHAQASWKNSSRDAGLVIPAQEELISGDLVVQLNTPQQAVADPRGDVPLPDYDLTSVAFQANGATFDIVFNTAGAIGPVGQPLQYTLFIDRDCYAETGEQVKYRGAEYRVRYNHETDRASVVTWDMEQNDWLWDQATRLDSRVDRQSVLISIPVQLLGTNSQFCWIAQASNRTDEYNLTLPRDWLPDGEHWQLTRQEVAALVRF
ncbi:MAG: hypothetical protein KJ077_33305 [Anaerolineae bacterium]|nr:hypothetical protein [Anaerolineae bacterium]